MDYVFNQSEPSTLPLTYIYKRALHRAHQIRLHTITILLIYQNSGIFTILGEYPFFFLLCLCTTYLMAPTCSNSRGSLIRRVRQFVLGAPQHFSVDLHLALCYQMVTKTFQHNFNVIKSFKPDIVIIQLGSNAGFNKRNSFTLWLINRPFCKAPARCISCSGHFCVLHYLAPGPVSF